MKPVKIHCNDMIWAVPAGTTLSCALNVGGAHIHTPCSGLGLCGKCLVLASGKLMAVSDKEKLLLAKIPPQLRKNLIGDRKGWQLRIACLARAAGTVKVVTLSPSQLPNLSGPILGIEVSNPDISRAPIGVGTPETLIEEMILFKGASIARRPSGTPLCGIAIDLGISFMTVSRLNLETGLVLNRTTGINPQILWGGDLSTRMTFVDADEQNQALLKQKTLTAINNTIRSIANDPSDLYQAVVTGNAGVFQLLFENPAQNLTGNPCHYELSTAKAAGLDIHPDAPVVLMHTGHPEIGSDTLAGAVAHLSEIDKGPCLYIQLGAQTDLLLFSEGRILGTSVIAGPALEGMNISCGSQPISGAIESVLGTATGDFIWKTIEDAEPNGICGSGLISLLALLLKEGVISSSGKLNPIAPDVIPAAGAARRFLITDSLFLGQRDIRKIQLAKAAVATAIDLLLKQADIPAETIEKTFISGNIGNTLAPKDLAAIGMIPKELHPTHFVGNGAMDGATLMLANPSAREAFCQLSESLVYCDIMHLPDFQNLQIEHLDFPKDKKHSKKRG